MSSELKFLATYELRVQDIDKKISEITIIQAFFTISQPTQLVGDPKILA